ncbi:MAG: hypothetical protein ABEJ64_00070 [Candidatus Nanohaloarchaea archaeon]
MMEIDYHSGISGAVALWVSTFVLGFLHGQGMLMPEPSNPLVHTTRDWLIGIVPFLVSFYLVEKGLERYR